MPAERSKCSRRNGADVNGLVWTIPVEPPTVADSDGISFTSNTVTFDEGPPPLVDAPLSEYILFPPTNDCPAPRRPAHSKKKPEDHIPRPPNAFILFRSSFIKSQHVSSEVETNHSTLSKIIGLTWKNLPDDERRIWHAKAKAALAEHKRKFPQYAFRPNQGRGKGAEKRKVREVGPKDHKRCAKIAELLVEGKKGQELDLAIQEFDKQHVPEIITRFEAPITERSYRRSSSAPIPDADSDRHTPRKSRSSSTRPSSPVLSTIPILPLPPTDPMTKQEAIPEAYAMPSFDQYSFPSQSPPSFDLESFSFDNHHSPMSSFTCDPLSEPLSPLSPLDTSGMMFNLPDNLNDDVSSPLSPSYMGMDDWARSSSPFSSASSSMPATPVDSFPNSPCPDTYGSYPIQPFEQSFAKSFEGYTYPSSCDASFTRLPFSNSSAASGFSLPPSFEQEHSKVHMVNPDLDFSAFMDSLQEYPVVC